MADPMDERSGSGSRSNYFANARDFTIGQQNNVAEGGTVYVTNITYSSASGDYGAFRVFLHEAKHHL
jgi:hypothetical protein